MKEHIQAIVTILALVNPVMCMAIFSKCVEKVPEGEKEKSALKAVAAIGIVLLIGAVAGTAILDVFGISLNAFACAGGGLNLMFLHGGLTGTVAPNGRHVPPTIAISGIPARSR